jgi:hypothetical protein
MIVEVVEALDLIFVESQLVVDIAYYNLTSLETTNSFLKIYFESTWISFSNTPTCFTSNPSCPPLTYNYSLNFASILFNF